tara:strand:- start:9942 stop:12227 length:2286 start_codon:yes stop_codon:yes gene_type:complete
MNNNEQSPKSKEKQKKSSELIFSDSNSSSENDSDSDYDPENDEDINVNDSKEYKKFLNSIFPSTYLKSTIKDEKCKKKVFNKLKNNKSENIKMSIKEKKTKSSRKDNKSKSSKKDNKSKSGKKDNKSKSGKEKRKKKKKETFKFPTDEEDEEDEMNEMMMNPAKFSIVYTFGDDFEDEFDNEDTNDCETENDTDYDEIYEKKIDDISEEEWEKVMRKEEEEIIKKEKDREKMLKNLKVNDIVKVKKRVWSGKYIGKITKVYKNKKFFDITLKNKEFEPLIKVKGNIIIEKMNKNKTNIPKNIKNLLLLKKGNPKKYDKKMKKYMDDLKEEEEFINKKKEKKEKNLNSQRLKKLLKEKNVTNDFSYFKNMKIKEQKNILKNLVEINKVSTIKKPYKIALIETNIKPEIKAIAMKKVNLLTMMDPSTGDYYKNKLWVDTFMNIPFGKYASLPIKLSDGLEKSQQFMKNAKKILDESVYGLNDAKMQIMQMIGGWISNPNAVGTAIAIQGPMGTGKTTLVKEGISKILNRPFAFIPLGGATDSSYLEGHSYTYEGSIWGKIVDTIINCKCMNPVFYFDELDKVSNTPKGEEIIGILTHLTDTTQNSQFHDKYFSNLDFDLSKALFIFSYNHEDKVNAILKDRMYQIKTKGYDKKDKNIIAKDYLIKSIEKNINFKKGEVTFAEGVFEHIIEKLTAKEKGVRNFKRCLEIIYSKLNLFRLMEKDTTLFEKDEFINVEFPFEVTNEIVDKLIKQNDKDAIPFGMYM